MPKQVNPLSVLKPATEIATSARVRLQKCRKHVVKLNDADMDKLINKAVAIAEEVELHIKRRLKQEQAR